MRELVAADPRDHVAAGGRRSTSSRATWISASSPARWPKLSLIIFRPSRSTNSIAALIAVAVDPVDQPLELAHEAAAVGQVDQLILVRELVELLDALLELRDLAAQRADLRDQPFRRRVDVGHLIRHCPERCPRLAAIAIARFQSLENAAA